MNAPVSSTPRLQPGNEADAVDVAQNLYQLAEKAAGLASDSNDILLARAAMAMEELSEWLDAHAEGDLVAVADAWADRAYVLFGDAVASGLPATELFEEVHLSSMSKEHDSAGTGKAIKGETYKPPEIQKILDKYCGE